MQGKSLLLSAAIIAAALTNDKAAAQVSYTSEGKRASVYLSIGANTSSYSPSTINVTQGNSSSYDLMQVTADNKKAPTSGGLAANVKVGLYFNHEQTMAVELEYDPAAYHVVDRQLVHLKGTVNNAARDTTFAFTAANGYAYYMNGANLLMVNFVYRYPLYQSFSHNLRFDVMGKAGIGPAMPHVYNTLSGKTAEYPSFQLGGYAAGIEAAFRLTILRHAFIEVAPKYTYVSYTDIGVYNGNATQKLTNLQVIFSVGYWFSVTRKNPLFELHKKAFMPLTIKPIHPEPIEENTN